MIVAMTSSRSMMPTQQRLPVFGIVLLVLGVALLLEKLDVIEFGWSRILWAAIVLVGALITIRAFVQNGRGRVFWGTLLFLYGLFFFLRSLDLVEGGGEVFLPATITILGFAFLMLFVSDPKDWHLLIPSVVLLAFGGAFMLTEVGYFRRWEVWDSIGTWWPVILVLVGLSMILRKRKV
jgi:hypothetical protein